MDQLGETLLSGSDLTFLNLSLVHNLSQIMYYIKSVKEVCAIAYKALMASLTTNRPSQSSYNRYL